MSDSELRSLDGTFERLARLTARLLAAPRAFVLLGESLGGPRAVGVGPADIAARFVASEAIRDATGRLVAALVVVDARPRRLDDDDRRALVDLAALGAADLEAAFSGASLRALDQGVLLVDRTASVARMNPAAERLLGFDAATVTRMWRSGEWNTYDEDGAVLPAERRPILRAVMSGQPVRDVVGWRRRDGERILLNMCCVPVADAGGALVVAFTDITEEHRSRRLLDATLETAPVGLAVVGLDRSIHRCNPMFARLSGRTAEELVGTDVSDLLDDPVERAMAQARADEIMSRKMVDHPRYEARRVRRDDGEEVWVTSEIAIIADPDQPRAIVATFDVSQQRRLNFELARFEHLFRHANDIITVVDAVGDVLYASPSTRRVLGHPEDWAGPAGLLDGVHPDDIASSRAAFHELLAGTRGSEPFTMRMRSATGEWRHLECVGVNLLDEPAVAGIVLTSRDTTERERLVAQLAHSATHDHLTGLANRGLLDAQLSAGLARAIRHDTSVGLCFVDLDGFKNVNDTWGHAAGDRLLQEVAARLRGAIRGGDLAARIGGDEFVVMMDPVADLDDARLVATRVRDAIVAEVPDIAPGFTCGASVGVAISAIDDTPETLVQRADAALYRAKSRRESAVVAC